MYNENRIDMLRKQYPVGTRIQIDHMEDDYAVPCGTKGKIIGVDDAGSLLMKWDNGSSLSIIPEVDSFHKIEQEEIQSEEIEPDITM